MNPLGTKTMSHFGKNFVSNSAFLWVKLQTDICWSVLFDLFIEKQMQCQKKIFVAQPHFVKKSNS